MKSVLSWSLVNPRDLAAYHDGRARLYGAMGMLLVTEPTEGCLRTLRASLVGGDRRGTIVLDPDMKSALGPGEAPAWADEYAKLRAQGSDSSALICKDAAAEIRQDALRSVSLPAVPSRAIEVQLLAAMASLTARRLTEERFVDAANATDLQAELLRKHARECLGELGDRLASDPSFPRYGCLGQCLKTLLDEDRALFASQRT